MNCPRCGSKHISNRESGMRNCATVGGLIGAATGINVALRGAQAGVTIGPTIGPLGMTVGGLAGVLVSGLLSGSAGCALGSMIGRVLDSNFLDNRACLDCGLTFRESSEISALNVHVTATADPAAASRLSTSPKPPFEADEEFAH
jgi:hypothetical protein